LRTGRKAFCRQATGGVYGENRGGNQEQSRVLRSFVVLREAATIAESDRALGDDSAEPATSVGEKVVMDNGTTLTGSEVGRPPEAALHPEPEPDTSLDRGSSSKRNIRDAHTKGAVRLPRRRLALSKCRSMPSPCIK